MLTNRPVIVTQSDLLSSSPLPLQKRGSPYSFTMRGRAPCGASLSIVGLDGIARRQVPANRCHTKRKQCEADNSARHTNCFKHWPKPQKR